MVNDGVVTGGRVDGTPEGKDANNSCSETLCQVKGMIRKPVLVAVCVFGGKDVVFEATVQIGRIRQDALQNRRRERDHGKLRLGESFHSSGYFVIAQIHDVTAVHNAQLGSGHADFMHDGDRFGKVGGKLIGDGGDGDTGLKWHALLYTKAMFFRRKAPKVTTFQDRTDRLAKAGFAVSPRPDGRVLVSKDGIGAVIGDEGKGHPGIEKAGVLIGSEVATLLNRGYQMFLETPSGKHLPAMAEQLKALHQFEDDVKAALDMTNLYNTSLGTTTASHMYDRVNRRDTGQQPKPWEKKDHSTREPETKGSLPL